MYVPLAELEFMKSGIFDHSPISVLIKEEVKFGLMSFKFDS